MTAEQRFYYLRIIKIIDTNNTIYPNDQFDKQDILLSLENKDVDFYIKTYICVMKKYKEKINKLSKELNLN